MGPLEWTPTQAICHQQMGCFIVANQPISTTFKVFAVFMGLPLSNTKPNLDWFPNSKFTSQVSSELNHAYDTPAYVENTAQFL